MGMEDKGNNLKVWIRFRIFLVLLFFFVAFMIVFMRAFQLQVVDREKLNALALTQSFKEVTLIPRRGTIYDRNMKELAISTETPSVYAHPERIENPKNIIKVLSPAVSMGRRELMRKINKDKPFVWIKRKIDFQEAEGLKGLKLEGVGVVMENKRLYPNLEIGSHVIGFAGIDSNGLEGIELMFDNYLKGAARRFIDERDAKGETIIDDNVDRAMVSRGMDIVLTIDKTIQYIAEKELGKAVASTDAKGGIAIVMDPKTGEILAMADLPSFDPNHFWSYKPSSLRNSAVADSFEPGSTFKTFLIAAGFNEDIIKPSEKFFCENGEYRVLDRVIHDAGDKRFGWLSVADIIKHSSNIGSAKIGEKIGKEMFYRYIKEFGFGSKTEIQMPGETAGNIPHYRKWSKIQIDTLSFGQGISVTGIQLATAFSAIANGGYLMKPLIARSIIDGYGNTVKVFNPEIKRRVINEGAARMVTEVLKKVAEDNGSGIKARIDGIEVAGKTGTAQKPDLVNGGYLDGKYMSSFIGFVPADDPRVVIYVLVDEPNGEFYGGRVAAPVFREMARQILPYLGVYLKEERNPLNAADDANDAEDNKDIIVDDEHLDSYIMPDFMGKTMRQVLRISREIPIEVEVSGSGRAYFQMPAPGEKVSQGSVCKVRFQ